MIIKSSKIGRLVVENVAFASGGAGEVYRAKDASDKVYCFKKLINIKKGDVEKITHMSQMAMPICNSGSLCWPIDTVLEKNLTGFIMPMAKDGSIDLLYLTNLTWPVSRKKPTSLLALKLDRTVVDGIRRRILICCNIAAAVDAVHSVGGVIVDLKPQNILLAEDGTISLVDLDSIQIFKDNVLYRGPLGTPQYMPPESFKINYDNQTIIDKSWDYFSLAVIFYEILLGIHPYTATAKDSIINNGTIADAIRFRMYVHGKKRSDLDVIPQPHEGIKILPLVLHEKFKDAFDSIDPQKRPTVKEWGASLFEAAKSISTPLLKSTYSVAPPRTRRVRVQSSSYTSTISAPLQGGVSKFTNFVQTSNTKNKASSDSLNNSPGSKSTNPNDTNDSTSVFAFCFWAFVIFVLIKSCNP